MILGLPVNLLRSGYAKSSPLGTMIFSFSHILKASATVNLRLDNLSNSDKEIADVFFLHH